MAGYDRISELPDSLLAQILSYLPTKDSVKTSVLSKRWEFIWLTVPVLDLKVNVCHRDNDKVMESFIDKFMEYNHESQMQKFKIDYTPWNIYEPWNYERLVAWIGTAVDRGIQHLHVDTKEDLYMPQNIYKSKTLVSLTLVSVTIPNPQFVVSLPCLKIMHLEDVWYDGDALIMEKVISGCPVLENLTLIRDYNICINEDKLKFLRVRSHTLKSFFLMFQYCVDSTDFSVEIDAPRLEYLFFSDKQSDRIVVKNLRSLVKIDIDSMLGVSPLQLESLSKINTIRDFLTGISTVKHMIISQPTFKVLDRYSRYGPIPKFVNLCRLDASYSMSMLRLLPVFLGSCPNLVSVRMDIGFSAQPKQIELSSVPSCLKSRLEYVEINNLIMKEEMGIKLVNYFLENSAVLKKLTVRFRGSYYITKPELDIYRNLLTSTKCSRNCHVFLF